MPTQAEWETLVQKTEALLARWPAKAKRVYQDVMANPRTIDMRIRNSAPTGSTNAAASSDARAIAELNAGLVADFRGNRVC